MYKRILFAFVVAIVLSAFTNFVVKAEGTYANIGTTTGSDGSPDAVSWSQGLPIMVDSYGHYIVPAQETGNVNYNLEFSNDKGSTWNEITGLNLEGRVSVAYDNVNDTLHAISASGNGDVVYRRYRIIRDSNYNITNFVIDPDFASLTLDSAGTCSAVAGNPIVIVKQINGDNYLLAFWSISKDCGVTQLTQTRGSGLIIQNDSSDGSAGSWFALNGTASIGLDTDANVSFNFLYSTSILMPFPQHSAMLADSGSHMNDIYYFNIDENDTHQFRRLTFDESGKRWFTSTTPSSFGGDVNDAQGYNLKRELLSKPVMATAQDRVYVGIARWLDNTNGDTQSLYYINSGDQVVLAGNVYSAGGAHCLYPTFDISYGSVEDKVYTFYLISGAADVCGNTYYKTFDGNSFSAANPFYTVANRSVDIPITYPNRIDDKIILFFRLNNASNAGTPPHEIYFGYIGLSATSAAPTTKTASNANYNFDSSDSDYLLSCASLNNTSVVSAFGNGYVHLKKLFSDEFYTPNTPYTGVFSDVWDIPGTWGGGSFNPTLNGNVNIYSPTGAYLISSSSFTTDQTFNFRAKFSQFNFEHVGIADNTGFNKYAIFSTGNDGILKARTSNGGESNLTLGTSYYDDYHDYQIIWTATLVTFKIDGTTVASFSSDIPTGSMKIVLSNNDHTVGADLLVDSASVEQNASSSGTYISCPIDSTFTTAEWKLASYTATLGAGHTYSFEVRTSLDATSWSSWSGNLSSGTNINQLGRYAQYRITEGSSNNLTTPELNDVRLNFVEYNVPNAIDDNVSTNQDVPFVIHLFANDLHIDSLDSAETILTAPASHGTADLVDAPNGGVFYTPNSSYHGVDQFTYKICDTYGNCDTAIAHITINPLYVGPTTSPESATVNNNTNVQISVLNNDTTDGTFNFSTLAVTTPAVHGLTSVNTSTGVITYTPNSGYVGSDSFTYNICDNHSLCQSAIVSLTVNAPAQDTNSSTPDELGDGVISCVDSKPMSPNILTVVSSSVTSATVSFRSSVGDFDSFQLQISKISGNFDNAEFITLNKSAVEYTYKDLLPNTTYYFRIRAKNGCNFSDWSSEFKASTTIIPVVQSVTEQLATSYPQANEDTDSGNTNILIIVFIVASLGTAGVVITKRRNKNSEEF